MKILDCMDYHFSWPYHQKLSEQMKNYLISLNIEEPIGIYLDVPKAVDPEDVGWAFIKERMVYVRPTNDYAEFELRLAHELTHIALIDQGYKRIVCGGDEELDFAFANLLHHLVLYPRLVAGGFSLQQDTKLVMKNLKDRLNNYRNLSSVYKYEGGIEYSIILLINDLIRLDPSEIEHFLLEANTVVPELISQAQYILELIGYRTNQATVEDYIKYKLLIEYNLGLGTYAWICSLNEKFS